MELLSKEIIEQLKAAKAMREAAKIESAPVADEEINETFDPIRDIEADADPEMDSNSGMWKASW